MFKENKNIYNESVNEENVKKRKKPFYKRWYFWVIAILIIGFIAIPTESKTKESNTKPTTQQSAKKEKIKNVKVNNEDSINYIKMTTSKLVNIGDSWSKVGEAMGKGIDYVYSNEGTVVIASHFVIIKENYEEVSKITVPSDCKELYQKWMEMKEKHLEAIELYTYGIDNMDVKSLEKANNLLEESTSIVDEISEINQNIIKK